MLNKFDKGFRFLFSTVKKQKMELTIRTPYDTILADFDGFSRIITKSHKATLVLQNKSPASLYVLPPGPLKIKLTQDVKGVSGDYLHLGGWLAVHAYNNF